MPYGMTGKEIKWLCKALAKHLGILAEDIEKAFMAVVREDALRIAKNEKEEW